MSYFENLENIKNYTTFRKWSQQKNEMFMSESYSSSLLSLYSESDKVYKTML